MPKIPPRIEVREHPLYRTSMDAQHVAYQLMRAAPPDHRVEAARLHSALVHATAWVVQVLDPAGRSVEEGLAGLASSAEEARLLLAPLARYAADARDAEALGNAIAELEKAATSAPPTPASSSRG